MPNKLTEAAGLTLNVNSVKKGIVDYFETNGPFEFLVQEGKEDEKSGPMLKKIHISLAATIESTCRYLCRNVCQITRIDKSGMRTVTRPLLRLSIQTNRELAAFFEPIINNTFVRNRSYVKELPVSDDEIKEVIDSINEKLNFKPKAFNLLCFMLVEVFNRLLADSTTLIEYAKKKSLDDRSVEFAARMLFRNCDEYRNTIVEDMTKAVANYDEVKEAEAEKKKTGAADDEDVSDPDDEIEVAATKKKGAKKAAAPKAPAPKAKPKAKHVDVSDEEDEEDEDGTLDDDAESSDEEVETKPVKRKTSKKSASKRTSRR